MRRLGIQPADIMRIAVQQESVRSEESRYDHRLHSIMLACSGLSCYDVAGLLGQSPRTVEYWVGRFEHSGSAGLHEGLRPGRPRALDEPARQRLAQQLRQSPRELGYLQNLWDGKLLSPHVEKAFGVHLGARQCQRLFRRSGSR